MEVWLGRRGFAGALRAHVGSVRPMLVNGARVSTRRWHPPERARDGQEEKRGNEGRPRSLAALRVRAVAGRRVCARRRRWFSVVPGARCCCGLHSRARSTRFVLTRVLWPVALLVRAHHCGYFKPHTLEACWSNYNNPPARFFCGPKTVRNYAECTSRVGWSESTPR